MDFQYLGANCIKAEIAKATFIIDPSQNAQGVTKKLVEKSHILVSGMYPVEKPAVDETLFLDFPGEYEIDGVALKGIQTKSHTDVHESDADSNVIYTLRTNSLSLCVMGNPTSDLSEEVFEQIGTVDILVVPVGGGGFTLDAKAANKIVKQIEPSACIVTHFDESKSSYDMPQLSYKDFFDEVGSGELVSDQKLKIKAKDLQDGLQVFALKV
ncbi:TPA: hypothetical protein EYO12_04580 [Candidatus Saccharibacteria bacterium]|nr:hypothetical protein [Candidatus Saccharibacteria bacterium]HIO87691.1 hypothetical protein [Candidatus Saccharibacteria bacterium]